MSKKNVCRICNGSGRIQTIATSFGAWKITCPNCYGRGTKAMTVEQMREKLLEWNPSWNVNRFTDQQIIAMYNKERKVIVDTILEKYAK